MTSPVPSRPPAHPAVFDVPGGGVAPDGAWRDLDASDRIWAGVCYTRSVTTIDLPDPDRVRAAVLSLARSRPELGRWVTADQRRWRPVEDGEWNLWLEQACRVSDEAGADPERVAALNAAPPRATQFRVLVGPDWISFRACHTMGDGWSVDHLVGAVLARAADETAVPPWRVMSQRGRDRLIRREVREHARTALWAARHRGELAGGVYEPIGPELAPGNERVVEQSSRSDFPRTMRALRDELFPGVSAAAVGMVALRAALAQELTMPLPGFECLFNTRDAAAGTGDCWGNFSAGIYLRPTDDYDPAAVAAALSHVRASGLAEIAHASLRLRGRRAATGPVSMPRAAGAPRMTMSYMQAHTIDPVIPGLRRYESRVGTISRPNGVDSLSVQQVECAGRTHVAVSYFPHRFDTATVTSALGRFLADPRDCLLAGRGTARP